MVFKAIWKPLVLTSLVALSLWGLSAWRYWAGKEAGKLVAADAERQLQLARADADRSGDKAAIAKA